MRPNYLRNKDEFEWYYALMILLVCLLCLGFIFWLVSVDASVESSSMGIEFMVRALDAERVKLSFDERAFWSEYINMRIDNQMLKGDIRSYKVFNNGANPEWGRREGPPTFVILRVEGLQPEYSFYALERISNASEIIRTRRWQASAALVDEASAAGGRLTVTSAEFLKAVSSKDADPNVVAVKAAYSTLGVAP